MKYSICPRRLTFAAALTWTLGASAQWSSDPAVNRAITNVDGEQVQVKIVARPDGGYFMSWFDNRLSGYDVYVQRLDAVGNPMLTADGSQLWGASGVQLTTGTSFFAAPKITATSESNDSDP